MPRRIPRMLLLLLAACHGTSEADRQSSDVPAQPYAPYTNLEVLPQDVGWPELIQAMRQNLHGLGLRETAGEGCLYCHVGSLETPMDKWDFSSDAKVTKKRARLMMRMVRSINETYLAKLDSRDSTATGVTCYTCHKGRIDPASLATLLERALAAGGMEEVASLYRRLRGEYYGRGVYDFEAALAELGISLANRGDYDDAVGMLQLNVDYQPTSASAHRWLVRIVIERAAIEEGAELRPLYDSLAATDRPDGALVWYTLRAAGVRLRRAGELEAAESVFSLNEQLYPDDHRIITDLALTRLMLGDTASAVTGARRALDMRPDYGSALELLQEAQPN